MTDGPQPFTEANPLRLSLGQTANPGQCGYCNFFRWSNTSPEYENTIYAERSGHCQVRLPPWVAENGVVEGWVHPNREQGREWRRIKDTDACDLHRHTGLTYITSQVVKP